jgi:hypothetical protein
LESQEINAAKNFINAFKNFDIEALDKARSPMGLIYVDRDFRDFAANLSFMASDVADSYGTSATAPFAASAPKKASAALKPSAASPAPGPAPGVSEKPSLEDELTVLNEKLS